MRICTIEGCENYSYAKNLCHRHYSQILQKQKIININVPKDIECDVEGCDRPSIAYGYCSKHYKRYKETGSPIGRVVGDYNDFSIQNNIVIMNLYSKRKKIAEFIFDIYDLDTVKNKHWYLGADGYPTGKINGKIYKFHKFILEDFKNEYTYDHIDRNKLNNTRENLRKVTTEQNMWNSSLKKNNKTGVRGVHQTYNKKYAAQMRIKGKTKHLGTFNTLLEAANVYKQKSIEYRGVFYER